MKFTEAQLEQAFIELLGNEEMPHIERSEIRPTLDIAKIRIDRCNS